jgi:2-polyprenyl-6-methoxyphenol hydroxylase-like FAD-dependent oxidoreductase
MTRTDLRTDVRTAPRRKVLISGASIAGPALAFWLNRYGFDVTVVEKAGALRAGGYPIDVRGTALDVVERMGILPRLRDSHIDLRRLTFLDGDGSEVVSVNPHAVTGGVAGRDLEVRRGDLSDALYAAVRDDVEFLFNDSIDTLDQSGHGVDVTFRGGGKRTFDMVFGADGMHSRTREMLFGPEDQFHRFLGYCFAVFTMRNTFGLSHETVMWNTPGRAAALYAAGDDDEVHAFLNFAHPQPPFDAFPSPEAQRDLIATVFADAGWEVPGMLAASATRMTCSSTRSARSACPAGPAAGSRWWATPRTRPLSLPGRAPAWRSSARTCSPVPWPTGTTPRASPPTNTTPVSS